MEKLREQKYTGERALFQGKNLDIEHCTFQEGESPLKESRDIKLAYTNFKWKYPLWYSCNIEMKDSVLFETARSGIWYTNNISIEDTVISAPKTFRRCRDITLKHVQMPNALESLWSCSGVKMFDVDVSGDYFGMNSKGIELDNVTITGNYAFDGASDIVVKNSKLLSKDAFWNCENVVVYDSYISGEYFGWNSNNVTLINCIVESEQGFCYMDNIKLENCKLLNTDLAFEYSTVDASIMSHIESVKNPYSGKIEANSIGEIIFDNYEMSVHDTKIVVKEEI